MNRDDLDAFFARAEDVLTDWHGDTDAMHARVPTSDEAELPVRADSYYAQGEFDPVTRLVRALTEITQELGRSMGLLAEAFRKASHCYPELARDPVDDADVRARALSARRSRGTGPANRIGLDGRRR